MYKGMLRLKATVLSKPNFFLNVMIFIHLNCVGLSSGDISFAVTAVRQYNGTKGFACGTPNAKTMQHLKNNTNVSFISHDQTT